MIDYSKVKIGDFLKIVGKGAPGFAKLGDPVVVTAIMPDTGVRVARNDYEEAEFLYSCGAERLEQVDLSAIILDALSYFLIENNAAYLNVHLCVIRKLVSEQLGFSFTIGKTYKLMRQYFPEIHFGNGPYGKFAKVDLKTINKYSK